MRAVVFAYSNVGDRCLRVLRARGIDVPLVVTHRDHPGEAVWFERVADTAADLGLPFVYGDDLLHPALRHAVAEARPDVIFSFYYRSLLPGTILDLAPRGAFNMHGSLLPHYRGRAPTNWAVLRGERETGATLHEMVAKADAGRIVDQQAVPILPDDTAREVFDKVTVAAEIALDAVLPALAAGTAPRRPQNLAEGSYFGGRSAKDGRIDWRRNARQIHDLVRAVAPPYPGALTYVAQWPARILSTRVVDETSQTDMPALRVRNGVIHADCGGGGRLLVRTLEIDKQPYDADLLLAAFGDRPVPLV